MFATGLFIGVLLSALLSAAVVGRLARRIERLEAVVSDQALDKLSGDLAAAKERLESAMGEARQKLLGASHQAEHVAAQRKEVVRLLKAANKAVDGVTCSLAHCVNAKSGKCANHMCGACCSDNCKCLYRLKEGITT